MSFSAYHVWRAAAAMVVVLLFTSVLPAQGVRDAETDVNYVPDDAFYAMVVRPRQMLEKYGDQTDAPVEALLKTAREQAGLDVENLESVTFVIGFDEEVHLAPADDEEAQRRLRPDDMFSMVMRFHAPPEQANILDTMFTGNEPAEHEGKKYHKSKNRYSPSAWFPDEKTLVIANDARLLSLMEAGGMGMGSLRHHLRRSDPSADGALVFSMDTGRPWFKMVFDREEIPLPMRPILELPTHLDVAVVTADLSRDEPAQMLALAVDEKSAKYLTSVTGEFVKTLQSMLDDNREEIANNAPSPRIGANMVDLCDRFLKGLKLEQEGRKIRGTLHAEGGMVAAAEMVVELFAQQQRQSEMWQRYSRLHTLAQGLAQYREEKKEYPAAAIRDDQGRPLLSWRVQLLPQIGEKELYEQFKLDEPWDSDHNKKLLDKMPKLFAYNAEAGETTTRLLAVTGKGTLFSGDEPLAKDKVTDAHSSTVAIVEVPEQLAVPWTKPVDFLADEKALTQLTSGGDEYDTHFLVITADGDVQQLKKHKLTEDAVKAMFSIAGGEEIELYQYAY